MKVTALIADDLINKVREVSGGSTITESLVIALTEWLTIKNLRSLTTEIEENPICFEEGFEAESVRALNRQARPR